MGKLVDRAKMSVSGTPGTGAISLGTAVTNYQGFAAAGVLNGDTISYLIEDASNTWEYGTGVYTTSGLVLTRNPIISSSGVATLINATSASIVSVTALAEDIPPNFMSINAQTALFSYTLAAGYNAFAVGPWSVATGITVTIPSGSRMVVI